jgi:hypothetical protein
MEVAQNRVQFCTSGVEHSGSAATVRPVRGLFIF